MIWTVGPTLRERPSHEALWIRDSSAAWPDRAVQGVPSERLAGSTRRDLSLEHSQLFHLSERRLPLRVLRISRAGSCRGYGAHRSGPEDAGMVVDHNADAAPARHEKDRRVVGGNGRGFPL